MPPRSRPWIAHHAGRTNIVAVLRHCPACVRTDSAVSFLLGAESRTAAGEDRRADAQIKRGGSTEDTADVSAS